MSVDDPRAYDSHDASELDDAYQSLAPLAVAALLISLASPAVLVWPLLLVVPCAAVALALVAMGKIARSDGALTGRGLALTAVAISVFSVAAWAAREQTYTRLMNARAEPVVTAWFGKLQEQDEQAAFLLTLDPPTRSAAIAYLQTRELEKNRGEESPPGAVTDEGNFEAKINDFHQVYTDRQLLTESAIESFELLRPGAVLSAGPRSEVVFQTWRVRFEGGASRDYEVRLEYRTERREPPSWRIITADPSEPSA